MLQRLSGQKVESSTLVKLLRRRALEQPERWAYAFVSGDGVEPHSLTYAELDGQARAIGALLQQYQVRGERVLLLYPPGLEFIAAFYGCLYSGAIAVPSPPPDAARLKRTLPRLLAIAKDAQASLVLTVSRILSMVEELRTQHAEFPAMQWMATENISSELATGWQELEVSSNALAYLQYTSGSTSTSKGVMVSHQNLMHHSACISQAWGYTPDSIAATWMPYFHDYGLVDGLIQPLYQGIPCFVMSPLTFVKRPVRWLQTISRYKVTHSQGPNFAYEHCVRRIAPEQCADLDLSSWRTASNGAEPVRPATLERFVATFQPYGFRWSAFYPAYGLAEATLLVSTKCHQQEKPTFCTVSTTALAQNQIVEATKQQPGMQTIVGCGQPIDNLRVVITHPETLNQCPPNEVGEIWVSDLSVAQGYWNRPEETKKTFQAYLADTGEGPFLRTGDLGFIQDGELFITGRLKDLIIIRGRNHYPQDIELTVEQSHPAMRPGHGAAFSVEIEGEERLVITQEVERQYLQNLDVDEVITTSRQAVAENHEVEVYTVLLLKAGSICKTSSGKIQRQACRASFLDGSLQVVGSWQANHTAKLKETVPNIRIHGTAATVTPSLSCIQTDVTAATSVSRARADAIISWLRGYADSRINSRLIDERRCIPPYVVLDFGNQGILGMQVPEQYGGIALRNGDAMRVVEQLAAIDLTLATFVCINNFLGIRPIQRCASDAIRTQLLPLLAQGRELAAFAITEPGAGSNPRAIAATGVADVTGGWRLRGTKIWSGSASWAGVINVFVQLIDANAKPEGIAGFTLRQGTPGLRVGAESLTMGMRGVVQNFVHLDDVAASTVDLLGVPGSGMEVAQDAMLFTRLAIAAMSVGGMKRCLQLMLRYATRRDIATGRLLNNPVTLARLSNLTAATTALETLVSRIAALLDAGCSVPVEAYVACKTSGPELLWQAVDNLVQLLGGRGYIETNIAPQLLRDARVFRIFEGPTEALNMFLGSRVLHQNSELQHFLCDELGAPSVYDSLKDAAAQIQARWSEPATPFSDRPSALRFAHLLLGEVATFAILLAAVQGAAQRTPSDCLHRAIAWAKQQFDESLAKALSSKPLESVLLSAHETTDLISSYTETIGDLEQTIAGEDNELDEFLRRPATAVVNPIQMVKPKTLLVEYKSKQPEENTSDRAIAAIAVWLTNWIAKELNIEPEAIDSHQSLILYGLDSVTAVGLIADLEVWLGCQLPPTLAWDCPSIHALAQHLAKERSLAVERILASDKQAADKPELATAGLAPIAKLPDAPSEVKSSQLDPRTSDRAVAAIAAWITNWIAKELNIELEAIDSHQSLISYGLDSVTAVGLIADLEVWLGCQLPPTLAWNYSSIHSLAQHLAGKGNEYQNQPEQ